MQMKLIKIHKTPFGLETRNKKEKTGALKDAGWLPSSNIRAY